MNDNILSSELRVYFVFFMTASTVRGPSNLILDKIVKHHFFFAMVTKRFFPLHIQNQAFNSHRSPSILQACHKEREKKMITLKMDKKQDRRYSNPKACNS